MGTVERRRDRARLLSARIRTEVGREYRQRRASLDLSLEAVARSAGISESQASRIERALLPHVALEDLVGVAVVLGLDLSVRAFPKGSPLRDAPHLALLSRLHVQLHPSLSWATEVPVASAPGDWRAWDAVIRGERWSVGVEAETRIRDSQELERRLTLKLRDGTAHHLLLLAADTRWNQHVLRATGLGLLELLPTPGRPMLDALRAGRDPGDSGIILL
ncbi:MAG: XRE family transcriptional regulator [Chloroflexota bacterium]|jgi:transcriptional regulator with XRE-family HTH domain|nr:MAG: XRE family transcriptional regulator [Chloroflexota bacterium]